MTASTSLRKETDRDMARTGRPQEGYRFTKQDYDKIKRWLDKGKSPEDIALHYGVLPKTLYTRLRRAGIEVPKEHWRKRLSEKNTIILSREQVREMKEQYEAGMSLDALGEHFCVSPPTAKRILRDAGVELPPRGQRSGNARRIKIPVGHLYTLYVEYGMTQIQVAKALGRSRGAVRRELDRNGWLRKKEETT